MPGRVLDRAGVTKSSRRCFIFLLLFMKQKKVFMLLSRVLPLTFHDAPGPGGGMVAAIRRRKWLEPRRNTRHQLLKKMAGATAEHPPSIAKKNGWNHGGTPAINC
jgi:hypothetical protein